MKKYIALIIVLVLAAVSICGYGIWKNNQPDKWNVNLVQPVEDETTIVYYDNPIKKVLLYRAILWLMENICSRLVEQAKLLTR